MAALSEVFAATLSPDRDARNMAEEKLHEVAGQPGFFPHLLKLIVDEVGAAWEGSGFSLLQILLIFSFSFAYPLFSEILYIENTGCRRCSPAIGRSFREESRWTVMG